LTLVPNKPLRKEIVADARNILGFAQRVFRLVETDKAHAKEIDRLAEEIAALKERVRTLEAREAVVVAQAEAAAAKAAASVIADLARRLGQVEGRGGD
jgi:cell division protein FtsB